MDPQDDKKRKYDEIMVDSSHSGLSREEVRKLLNPLDKDQLIDLLIDLSCTYPGVAEDVRESVSKNPAHRKLFIRGLAWETTTTTLREAFSQYGEIEEGAVIVDKATGKSRGYGFITFKNMESAYRALKESSKRIDGRITVCNLAASGASSGPSSSNDSTLRKVYIGGLSYDTTSEQVLNIFSQYGDIEEGAVAYDKASNKSRGFAFVTFRTVEAAKKACSESTKTIDGRQVIVKIAAEGQKDKSSQSSSQQMISSQPVLQQQALQGYGSAYGGVNPSLGSLASYRPSQLTAQQGMAMAYSNPTLSAVAAAYNVSGQPGFSGLSSQYTGGNPNQQYPGGLSASTGSLPLYFTGNS